MCLEHRGACQHACWIVLGVLAEYLASTLAGCVWNIGCLPRGLAGATCRRRLEQKEFLQRRGWNTGTLGIHQHGLEYGLHLANI